MIQKLRAIYRQGSLVLQDRCHLVDDTEVQVTIDATESIAPQVVDPEVRIAILKRVTRRMRDNPLPAMSPRLTRDELHARGWEYDLQDFQGRLMNNQ